MARILLAASAGIILLLGSLHLIYTFYGPKLRPREPELQARMDQVSPVISRETTMWRAWVGFNASHSFGAILFGLIYGYLATVHAQLLFGSVFLLGTGLALLAGYTFLALKYWFSIPLRGIVIALVLYAGAVLASLA
ncbi:LIC_13387 family protein [Microbulbifer hainanensis]|uniref:LIC_13387 family protein n=1 Tax=Microbulbifer hainanensis TaxID=2735675 RepID=UPI00385758D8